MSKKKRATSVLLAMSCVIALIGGAFTASALSPADHIVGDLAPPAEAAVSAFTVGLVNPDGSSYAEPMNTYYSGNPRFYFVTGDPSYAGLHGGTTDVVRPSGVYAAEVIYSARTSFTQGNLTIAGVSPLPNAYFSRLAGAAAARANASFFFDAGKFMDMDYFDTNNLSGDNTSIVGLYREDNGEPATTIFKRPEPTTNTMMRWRFNTPDNYIENIIFDGSSVNMRPPNGWGSGNDRGSYFWVVGIGSDNFVARDVILQNIGSQNTSVMNGGLFAGAAGNQRNVALNVLRATTGQRNFENLTIRNVMTTSGYAVIQFNNVADTYFRDLNIRNPNAAGIGTAQHASAYPIKIEHAADWATWLGSSISNQRNIVFDGDLLPPNRGTVFDGVYVQDYLYRNILLPGNFAWALCRNANGNTTNFALRVYNRKMSPIANNAALQLDTGYWFAEAAVTAPNLQAQLNTINAVRTVAGPLTSSVPAPNIKVIANHSGQIGGFTIPNYSAPRKNIVALTQTASPNVSLYPATAHASNGGTIEFVPYIGGLGGIIFPAGSDALIFNFNFKAPAGWTIEAAEDGAIANFTRANSGRNLFLRHVATVSYTIAGDRPYPHPAMPGDETVLPGTAMTVASDFAPIEGENVGVPGTWTFNGWTTDDVVVADGEFIMPNHDVVFVGSWTFIERPPMPPYHPAYVIGYPEDDTIRPDAKITRAEAATLLFRLISDEYRAHIWSQENPFPDVELNQWFNNAVSTLTNAGMLAGYPDGYFRPDQAMTHAEFSALMLHLMGFDHAGDGANRPEQFISRAEVAAFVNHALGRLPEHADDLLSDMLTWPDNMDPNAWYYLYLQEATNAHYHVMKADGVHEKWTALLPPREWWRLERPDSTPHIFTDA